MINIVFLGTAHFSSVFLQNLIQDKSFNVKGVVTKKAKKVGRGQKLVHNLNAQVGVKNNISVLKTTSLKKNKQQFYTFLEEIGVNVDFFVVVSFAYFIPDEFLQKYKNKFINYHPSLLPKYRGCSPIHAPILHADKETGESLIYLTNQMDAGDIIAQQKVQLKKQDTFETLYNNFLTSGPNFLKNSIKSLIQGKAVIAKQDNNKATFTKFITKQDGYINFKEDPFKIYCKFKAYKISPTLHTFKSDLESFLNISLKNINKEVKIKLVDLDFTKGKLVITSLQLPNKAAISFKDFLRSYKISK